MRIGSKSLRRSELSSISNSNILPNMDLQLTINRVKLPKSFLAVNLSESHSFHKKEDFEEVKTLSEEPAIAEMTAEPLWLEQPEPEAITNGHKEALPMLTTEAPTPTSLDSS